MHKIPELVKNQRQFFETQQTKNIGFRKAQLKSLLSEIIKREQDVLNAMHNDFKKPVFEGMVSETGLVINELKHTIKKLNRWSAPKRVLPSLLSFPSSAKIYPEPYGTVLIISPWNYPFQLALFGLIGAIAAGNTVVLKPSELTPNTSRVIREIIETVFSTEYVCVVEGEANVAQELLAQRWDYIFFTGSNSVGKLVAKAAAEHITPCTLELGGKSPCVIDESANIKLAARRVLWGKCLNAGQTCISPDYVLIHQSVKYRFTEQFNKELANFYGDNPKGSNDFARIINDKNFNRLAKMLEGQTVLVGGDIDPAERYISPTLLDEPADDSLVMQEEIFGPILPVISYKNTEELHQKISIHGKPLAFYIFSSKKKFIKQLLNNFSFGGGAINDTNVHFANSNIRFGGVGESGYGGYHGKHSFDTFSHKKGMIQTGTWIDIPVRYAPYKGKLKVLKAFLRLG